MRPLAMIDWHRDNSANVSRTARRFGYSRPTVYRWLARYRVQRVDRVASRSYLRAVRAVGLKVLKNRLSEYVRLAASGETILVTDRERVVAELVPPGHGRAATSPDALLADAVRQGWLTPAVGRSTGPAARRPVAKLAVLLEELDGDRADR
jgi:antitoxin (DNA-binding transcriptional repressor) of toxin-antitoxin stability system